MQDNFIQHDKSTCGGKRTCDICARMYQAELGNKAEAIFPARTQLYLSRFTPPENSPQAIKALWAKLLRREIAKIGLLTVEAGEQYRKLHINILSTEPKPALIHKFDGYCEPINKPPRAVAAYISKRSGMPTRSEYPGRITSTFGHISTYMLDQKAGPIIQAATINDIAMTWMQRNEQAVKGKRTESYKEAAKRHLPALRDFLRRP